MSSRPDPSELDDKVLVNTPVLDRLQQTSLPFRGRRREEILKRVRFQIKSRRTSGAIANRVANVTVGTVTEAIDGEARAAMEENVESFIEKRFRDE